MPDKLRHLRQVVIGVSLSLCLVFVFLWPYSCFHQPMWRVVQPNGSWTVIVSAYGGHLTFRWTDLDKVLHGQFINDPPGTNSPSGWIWPRHFALNGPRHWVVFPLWVPALCFALLPSVSLYKCLRRRRRLRHGQCVSCGYDLRASGDNCPECGSPR